MKNYILFLAIILLATSCKVKEVFVSVPEIHTEYKTKIQVDSIYLKDSVFIHQRNDTIFAEKFRTKYVLKHVSDTLLKNDTITKLITNTEIKEINVLTWWQKALIWTGVASIIIFLIIVNKKLFL